MSEWPRSTFAAVRARTERLSPLLRAIGRFVVPVCDHVLVTEPLSADQRAAIRWHGRSGLEGCAKQFHSHRQSDHHRILWSGYDAVYHWRDGSVALL